MSEWAKDITDMHNKFGVHDWVNDCIMDNNFVALNKFLKFRIDFLQEELNETAKAVNTYNSEEIVDGLIDLCVIAIGTLDILGVDSDAAWKSVHEANMSKEPGIKESRPNPLGLPDMIKPEGWIGPNHSNNIGDLYEFLKDETNKD